MSGSLNQAHVDMVEDHKEKAAKGTGDAYMLTIARDGEYPVRSIYFYDNAVAAAAGYAAYQDWGFAKDYLTVELHEPNGRVHSKILERPRGGECVFHREQYHQLGKILKIANESMNNESYNTLVYEFAKLFSQDNQRFDVDRFFDEVDYTGDRND